MSALVMYVIPIGTLLLAAAWITRPDWFVPWATCKVLGHRARWTTTYGCRGAWICARCGNGVKT